MKTLWDAKAGVYDRLRRLPLSRTIYDREMQNLAALLPERTFERHIDIGTGTGSSLVIFSRPTRLLVLTDISRAMLKKAQRLQNVPAVLLDANTALPFAANSFDLLSAIGVSEYIRDLQLFLRELARIAAPDADLLLTSSPPRLVTRLRRLNGARPFARSDEEMIKTFEQSGWQTVDSARSFMQTQWLCRKAPEHHENSMADHKTGYAL